MIEAKKAANDMILFCEMPATLTHYHDEANLPLRLTAEKGAVCVGR